MQQFPQFSRLPSDIRSLIAQQPGVFSQMAPLSREYRQYAYNPAVLRVKCNLPIHPDEVKAVGPLYFNSNDSLRLLGSPPQDFNEFIENPTILQANVLKIANRYQETVQPLALNLETNQFFSGMRNPINQPNFNQVVNYLWLYDITELPAIYLKLVYQRRRSCLNLDPNYVTSKVLEHLDRNVQQWLELIRQNNRLLPLLVSYLEMFVSGLDNTFPFTNSLNLNEVLRIYQTIRQQLPALLR